MCIKILVLFYSMNMWYNEEVNIIIFEYNDNKIK